MPSGGGGSGDGGGAGGSEDKVVGKIGVRVPPFWPEEPEIWFAQVEGQFAIAGITTDSTKFNYVISQLDNIFAKEVKDIIVSPPPTNKYDKLKSELIKRLSATNEKKLEQLLVHEELGDRKPSQFLRHLKGLAGEDVKDSLIKTMWLTRLPTNIRSVLAGQPDSTGVDVLADLADRINDMVSSSPSVASMTGVDNLSALTREIAELRKELHNLKSQASHSNDRSRSREKGGKGAARGKSRSRSQSSYRKFPVCWYHSKFAEKATRCMKPCDYKPGNGRGSQ